MTSRDDIKITRTRLGYRVLSMRLPDGPATQMQRSTRWYAQRLDGTWMDCGLEETGYELAVAALAQWEAVGS